MRLACKPSAGSASWRQLAPAGAPVRRECHRPELTTLHRQVHQHAATLTPDPVKQSASVARTDLSPDSASRLTVPTESALQAGLRGDTSSGSPGVASPGRETAGRASHWASRQAPRGFPAWRGRQDLARPRASRSVYARRWRSARARLRWSARVRCCKPLVAHPSAMKGRRDRRGAGQRRHGEQRESSSGALRACARRRRSGLHLVDLATEHRGKAV